MRLLLLACSLLHAIAVAQDPWPEQQAGQRTAERVAAGKRAARMIACDVCSVRVSAEFGKADPHEVLERGDLADAVTDVKKFCVMKNLAVIFSYRKMHVTGWPNGTATLEFKMKERAKYEEINESELLFDWKASALQHACTEVFRKDGDAIVEGMDATLRQFENQPEYQDSTFRTVLAAAQTSCAKHSRICRKSLLAQIAANSAEL